MSKKLKLLTGEKKIQDLSTFDPDAIDSWIKGITDIQNETVADMKTITELHKKYSLDGKIGSSYNQFSVVDGEFKKVLQDIMWSMGSIWQNLKQFVDMSETIIDALSNINVEENYKRREAIYGKSYSIKAEYPNLSKFELLGEPDSDERWKQIKDADYALPHVFWSNNTWDKYTVYTDYYEHEKKMGNTLSPNTQNYIEKLRKDFMQSLNDDREYVVSLPAQDGDMLKNYNRYLKDFERYT